MDALLTYIYISSARRSWDGFYIPTTYPCWLMVMRRPILGHAYAPTSLRSSSFVHCMAEAHNEATHCIVG